MPSVWDQRWAELVRRMTALHESTSLELLPDLMPVLEVSEPTSGEQFLLRRERLCGGWCGLVPTAGQNANLLLQNLSPNLLITVDRAWVRASAAADVRARIGVSIITGSPATTKGFKDVRGIIQSSTAPMAELRVWDVAGTLTGPDTDRPSVTVANEWAEVAGPWVLSPQTALAIVSVTVTVTLEARFHWRERFVEPEELNPTGA
jgi:hypothetical protein